MLNLAFAIIAFLTLSYWIFMLWDTFRSRQYRIKLPSSGTHAYGRVPQPAAASPERYTASASADDGAKELPLVSVIIAAKEEEASITETVKHLLNQTYPRLEIIAVNDRSQDGTGRKLEELRKWSEGKEHIPVPLRIIHVTRLPDGWLGKNHALYQGYQQARGQLVLFTDADVLFEPDTVADAVGYMREHEVDHLTLAPRMIVRSFWLRAFVNYFFFTLSLYVRPWRANADHQHKHGMGIGAFNLLTRAAYERIGTHKAFALRPDDDLMLGQRVKRAGLRQRLVSGQDHLAVEWYSSLKEAVKGLEKNLFSGFQYRLSLAAAAIIGQLVLFLLPFLGVLLPGGWIRAVFALSILLMLAIYLQLIRSLTGGIGKEVLALPVTICILCYIVIRSVGLTLRQGGIYWRGTFYSLDELKQMQR
ncbi:glycosyltransferase [Paenibacillus rigui]|uniref:4,4'-diaponeurosporenoate glycosyltransferase n=1 Tax=Paenibacillus rigui TaxID=554312 RepID=A0A229UL80_9BACL|nr:glycosyltransferase [Paenibacillus rigui]OXM83669.1 glycosyl transferase family 2 [Paenibacillus rigui]